MGMLRDYETKFGDQEIKILNLDDAESNALFILDLVPADGEVAALRVGLFGN
jgi:hypothetical protein